MTAATDSFGSYGRRGHGSLGLTCARAADRVVTWAIAIILALVCAVSGYAVWDSWNVLNGGNQLVKPTDSASFAELLAINPDVCAWLTIDNTNIDYAVTQGEDNFEYLTKDASGEYAASGSLFLDVACDRTFPGPYEVIMGHHMQAGKMFGDLDKFLDEDFFNENSTGELMLPDKTLSLEVVAVMQVDAYDRQIFGTPVSSDGMASLVEYIHENALFERSGSGAVGSGSGSAAGSALSAEDHVIALSTCASSGANARTVLICRVTGERSSTPADE